VNGTGGPPPVPFGVPGPRVAMSSGCGAGLVDVDSAEPIVLELIGRITPADVPLLCAQLRAQVVTDMGPDAGPDTRTGDVVCDVGGLTVADLTAVNAVARLRLTARRLGRNVRLRNAGRELILLLDFVGLGDNPDHDEPVLSPPP
jgi:hypothetical protein